MEPKWIWPYYIHEIAEEYLQTMLSQGHKKGNIVKTLVNVTSLKLYNDRTPPDLVFQKYNKILIVIDLFLQNVILTS